MRPTLSSRTSRGKSNNNGTPTAASREPDVDRALRMALEMMAIAGPSGQEGKVVEYVTRKLRRAGVPAAAISTDNAHRKSPLSGEVGNLICKLPGTQRGPRRLLMAHLDTVPLCVGCQPVVQNGLVRSADRQTGLGADDRAGATVVLNTALEILEHKLPHPPLTFFWPIQEEVGLHGAQFVQLSKLGGPKLAFNWDGGSAEKITLGATGAYRLQIVIHGVASHAGVAPERGVSAIAIAALAIASLHAQGWHGNVQRGKQHGTSNIGYIQGGGPTNVVTDRVELKAEARSHDPAFRTEILEAVQQAFQKAAQQVKSVSGAQGEVQFKSRLDYESFQLSENDPSLVAAVDAVKATGGVPLLAVTNGGLDANWMTARGIATVTLGCGQQNPHTVAEALDINEFHRACRVALRLAMA